MDAVIPGIRDVNRTVWSHSDAPGLVEGSGWRLALRDITELTPDLQHFSIWRKMLDAVVLTVGHIQAAIRCYSQVTLALKLTGLAAVDSDDAVCS